MTIEMINGLGDGGMLPSPGVPAQSDAAIPLTGDSIAGFGAGGTGTAEGGALGALTDDLTSMLGTVAGLMFGGGAPAEGCSGQDACTGAGGDTSTLDSFGQLLGSIFQSIGGWLDQTFGAAGTSSSSTGSASSFAPLGGSPPIVNDLSPGPGINGAGDASPVFAGS